MPALLLARCLAVWLAGKLGGEVRVKDSLGLCWRSCTNTWFMGGTDSALDCSRWKDEGGEGVREGGGIREGEAITKKLSGRKKYQGGWRDLGECKGGSSDQVGGSV